jgi:hypothetical protein
MADYYPLIAKAVTGLSKSTGEARRAVYERARSALVGQLRGMTPPLSESEITRERLALEEAIRKVEAEAARRMRAEPKADPTPEPPPPPSRRDGGGGGMAPQYAPSEPASRNDPPQPRPTRNRLFERSQLTDKGLKGFRDVVAEAETLGEKTAQASKSARAAYAVVPASIPEIERVEPRVEPEGLRSPAREQPPRRAEPAVRPEPRQPEPRRLEARQAEPEPRPEPRQAEPPIRPEPRPGPGRKMPPQPPQPPMSERRVKPPTSRKGVFAAVVTLCVIFGLAIGLFVMRDRIPGWIGTVRSLTPQAQRDAPRPKIPDRVGQDGQVPAQPPLKDQSANQTAAVAQRVVLYEEDPADTAGKRYVGSAIWRTEMVTPVQGQPPELAVRCDVEIPERRIAMTFSMRRNTDQILSHTIEIIFNLPPDFPFGGVANVPQVMMKSAEATRGVPLAGSVAKVMANYFLIGLPANEFEMPRNIQLLKERTWFDIPIVYNNGRRAILAIEKGTPGERVFTEAFAAWKQ